jgi:undecaprenyl-diphosphatase
VIPEHDGPVEPPHQLSAVHRFDDAVDRAIDSWRGREPSDRIIYALTELGDFSLIWHLLGWTRALRSERDLAAAVRLSVCLGIESIVVNGLVKSAFKRERPVYQGDRPHRLRIPLTTSFPSGHASSAVVAAMLLSEDRRTAPAYWALAAAVATSRVHVRIHHASDVIGGAAVGLGLGLAFRALWKLPGRC